MGFEAHGHYDIQVQGEIFIVRFYQSWNLEGTKAFFKDYKAIILEQGFEKFGVLGDLRKFEGGPPDASAVFEKISKWTYEHGQIARAQLADEMLGEYMINMSTRGKLLFPVKTFDDEKKALAWLKTLGLDIG